MEGEIQEPGLFRINRLSVLRTVRPGTVTIRRANVYNLSFHGFGIYFGYPSIPESGIKMPVPWTKTHKVVVAVTRHDGVQVFVREFDILDRKSKRLNSSHSC